MKIVSREVKFLSLDFLSQSQAIFPHSGTSLSYIPYCSVLKGQRAPYEVQFLANAVVFERMPHIELEVVILAGNSS